jgi:serine/threonine-protein kinase
VINQPVDLAIANLSKAGFKGVPLNTPNAKVAQGTVFQQNPPPRAHRHPGTVIAIIVSSGPPTVTVGDLSQLTERQAIATLSHQGLKVRVLMAPNPNVPAGVVTAQAPAQSMAVPVGSTVNITVSSGAKAPPHQP